MDQEVAVSIVEKKFEFLQTYGNASMLWWVSSVVFCASLVAAVWRFRKDVIILPKGAMHTLFFIVAMFFLSIVVYGVLTQFFIEKLRQELLEAITRIEPSLNVGTFEYTVVAVLIGLGTTSFTLILVVWIFIWRYFCQERRTSGSAVRFRQVAQARHSGSKLVWPRRIKGRLVGSSRR